MLAYMAPKLASAQPSSYDSGTSACRPPNDHFPFCNTSLGIDARVNDLISRINAESTSLQDKANLLTARGHDRRQALPKLGVPSYYWGSNCIHSSMFSNCTSAGKCSTSFPSGPSWAATFDKQLMQDMAIVIGEETRAGFNLGNFTDNGGGGLGLDCWGPVLNMNRDPRWGRNGEGGTEDPYLMSELGTAWTRGLQEGRGKEKRFLQVAVTLKHFDANSLEGGSIGKMGDNGKDRHTVNVNVSKYLLADYYWPAFKKPIRAGGAKGVMCSYNSVNGVPTCVDPLMRAAREAWNFSGYVTSDSDAVRDAYFTHHYFASGAEATCAALKDGQCDVDSGNTFYENLQAGVQQGLCAESDVDRALFNTFKVRFELGLFDPIADQPYWRLGEQDIGTDAAKAMNLRAAQSSLVLVQVEKNPGAVKVLPMRPGQKIAMIGPHANATMDLIQHDTGAVCPDGANENWNRGNNRPSSFHCVTSPFAALRDINDRAGGSTTLTPGCGLFNHTPGDAHFSTALAAAADADVVVLGLGISERDRTGVRALVHLETEGHDRSSIDLPEVQKDMAKALISLGKPTVIFLLNGGMVALDDFVAAADSAPVSVQPAAIVEAFYPGMEGAKALAMSLFGQANRWGKMPYTVYKASWADETPMLDHDVTHKRTYRYGADAVVAFGSGLSLTSFDLAFAADAHGHTASPLTLTMDTLAAAPTSFTVEVTNSGSMVGDEVVMAYFAPVKGTVQLPTFPQKALFDFVRVSDLAPGQSASVTLTLGADSLLLPTEGGDLVRAPGNYTLSFENGAGKVLHSQVALTGSQVVVEPFPKPREEQK